MQFDIVWVSFYITQSSLIRMLRNLGCIIKNWAVDGQYGGAPTSSVTSVGIAAKSNTIVIINAFNKCRSIVPLITNLRENFSWVHFQLWSLRGQNYNVIYSVTVDQLQRWFLLVVCCDLLGRGRCGNSCRWRSSCRWRGGDVGFTAPERTKKVTCALKCACSHMGAFGSLQFSHSSNFQIKNTKPTRCKRQKWQCPSTEGIRLLSSSFQPADPICLGLPSPPNTNTHFHSSALWGHIFLNECDTQTHILMQSRQEKFLLFDL